MLTALTVLSFSPGLMGIVSASTASNRTKSQNQLSAMPASVAGLLGRYAHYSRTPSSQSPYHWRQSRFGDVGYLSHADRADTTLVFVGSDRDCVSGKRLMAKLLMLDLSGLRSEIRFWNVTLRSASGKPSGRAPRVLSHAYLLTRSFVGCRCFAMLHHFRSVIWPPVRGVESPANRPEALDGPFPASMIEWPR